MSHQLNIKDAETNALVAELATLTGRSKTEVVKRAVAAELSRYKTDHARDIDAKLAEIRALQARFRAVTRPEDFLTDDDLYDENGLPT